MISYPFGSGGGKGSELGVASLLDKLNGHEVLLGVGFVNVHARRIDARDKRVMRNRIVDLGIVTSSMCWDLHSRVSDAFIGNWG